jgi:hypothetical protein
MRASEIKIGKHYATTGKGITLARVRVLSKVPVGQYARELRFRCLVEEGEVYQGWLKTAQNTLDMAYVKAGEVALLLPRDILRTWEEELERRTAKRNVRRRIHMALAEMDAMLINLGLPDVPIQPIPLPDGYTAVAVLSLDDVRRLHDTHQRAELGTVEQVPGPGEGHPPGHALPEPSGQPVVPPAEPSGQGDGLGQ